MGRIELSRRAQRDLQMLATHSKGDFAGIRDKLTALAASSPDGLEAFDIASLHGHRPWLRMRVGSWRVLFRPIEDNTGAFLVARVVNRRDLHRTVRTLG